MQTGIAFIDDQRQSFAKNVQHWARKKGQSGRRTDARRLGVGGLKVLSLIIRINVPQE
jgi:hypothetical protein